MCNTANHSAPACHCMCCCRIGPGHARPPERSVSLERLESELRLQDRDTKWLKGLDKLLADPE